MRKKNNEKFTNILVSCLSDPEILNQCLRVYSGDNLSPEDEEALLVKMKEHIPPEHKDIEV